MRLELHVLTRPYHWLESNLIFRNWKRISYGPLLLRSIQLVNWELTRGTYPLNFKGTYISSDIKWEIVPCTMCGHTIRFFISCFHPICFQLKSHCVTTKCWKSIEILIVLDFYRLFGENREGTMILTIPWSRTLKNKISCWNLQCDHLNNRLKSTNLSKSI